MQLLFPLPTADVNTYQHQSRQRASVSDDEKIDHCSNCIDKLQKLIKYFFCQSPDESLTETQDVRAAKKGKKKPLQ